MPIEFWAILGIIIYIEACILCAQWFTSSSFDHYDRDENED